MALQTERITHLKEDPDPLFNIRLNTSPLGYPPFLVLELKDSKLTILRGNKQFNVEQDLKSSSISFLCIKNHLYIYTIDVTISFIILRFETNLTVKLFILNSVEMSAQTSTWESRLYFLELELHT